MTLQKVAGYRIGEDVDDLRQWLLGLEGCPEVTATFVLECANALHGDDRPTWFFVEGDADAAVARRRCLACGAVRHLLDSEQHWNHPPMRSCGSCAQSMFEVAVGLHVEGAAVTWLALGVRCVGCGCIEGITDINVPDLSIEQVLAEV